jgi:hypothetical protein
MAEAVLFECYVTPPNMKLYLFTRTEILSAVVMKSSVFCAIMPCSAVKLTDVSQ